jgi:hypothetical protein
MTKGWGSAISRPKGGWYPFWIKKEKFEENRVKKSILDTFGATNAQKRLKRG